jgi:hypothetical protein
MPLVSKPRICLAGTLNLNSRGREVAPLFSEILESEGFEIVNEGVVDILVNINHNWHSINERLGRDIFRVLIRLEPAAVYPAQFTKEIESQYNLILTPGQPTTNEQEFIRWPYQFQQNPLRPDLHVTELSEVLKSHIDGQLYSYQNWSKREVFCSLIAANKVSPNGTGNYGLRRNIVKEVQDLNLEVYGELWKAGLISKLRLRLGVLRFALSSRSKFHTKHIFVDLFQHYPRVKGRVQNKQALVANSKFSLVIENSDTYISEKLIDALISGSIPIYFGTSFTYTTLPEGLVVRYSGEVKNLIPFLLRLENQHVELVLKNIEEFVLGDEIQMWDAREVFRTISRKIKSEYLGGK